MGTVGARTVSYAAMLICALILDTIFGEPDWLWRRLPHPAILLGRLVSVMDEQLNTGDSKRFKGILAIALIVIVAGVIGAALANIPLIGPILSILGAAILLAHRSLIQHVRAVASGLSESLAAGRIAVAQIVGRDPETLDEAGVARAAIESSAENFSDGVIAPAFWFLIAGLPGILIYKAVNTADSMIGHRSEKYLHFGWAAARLDDLLNLIPARLTGFLIAYRSRRSLKIMLRDAKLHKSPNAGWPESALAAELDLSLAGPRIYDGALTDDPWLNESARRDASAHDIAKALILINSVWIEFLAALIAAAYLAALLS